MAYGGALVSQGNATFTGIVLAGTFDGTVAQIFLYLAGYYGGRPFLERYGKYIFLKTKHLDIAEKWLRRYGTGVIFTARFIPVVRHAISIPAGIAKMPFLTFLMYTLFAMVPWSIFLFI